MYHVNINQRRLGIAILISDDINFKANYQRQQYIMTTGLTHQKYIAISNVYLPKNKVEKYMKQKLMNWF